MAQEPADSRTPEAQTARLHRELRILRSEMEWLQGQLGALEADLERVARSRAWRLGHRVTRTSAAVLRRRQVTQGAVAEALERIRRLKPSPVRAARGAPWVHRRERLAKLDGHGGRPVHVAMVGGAPAGAAWLSQAASALGWRTTHVDSPAEVPADADYVFAFEPALVRTHFPLGVAVAWLRGDADRWSGDGRLDQFDLLLAAAENEAAVSYAATIGRTVLPIPCDAHPSRLVAALLDIERRLSFCIKFNAPGSDEAATSGDLHFASALARELRRRGCRALLQPRPEWERDGGAVCDVVLVLRGRGRYQPSPHQMNVLWCISHPADLTPAECEAYDLVCVASPSFAAGLAERLCVPVVTLEQATDPLVFHPEPVDEYRHELVFVGNTRGVRRPILDDLLPTPHDLAVYGAGWDGLVDSRHLAGRSVPNHVLRRVYSSAALVLNDHWDDMRENGFVSNRVYDAVACGAMVVSDAVAGMQERFAGAVVTYGSREELRDVLVRFLADPAERAARGEAGRAAVLAGHTFAHRVEVLLSCVTECKTLLDPVLFASRP